MIKIALQSKQTYIRFFMSIGRTCFSALFFFLFWNLFCRGSCVVLCIKDVLVRFKAFNAKSIYDVFINFHILFFTFSFESFWLIM